MTIATTTSRVDVPGNGVATVFSFAPVTIYTADDLGVTIRYADGTETIITRGPGINQYTMGVTTFPGTGSITYPSSGGGVLASGQTLVMKRNIPLTQSTHLGNQGGYFPEVIEAAFDRQIAVSQQQEEEIGRCLTVAKTDTAIGPIPNSIARANMVLGFDGGGNPIAVVNGTGGGGGGGGGGPVTSAAMAPVTGASTIPLAWAALGEIQGYSRTYGQVRLVGQTGYGVLLLNDDANFSMGVTAFGNKMGAAGALAPFSFSLSTGAIIIDGTGAGVTFGGNVSLHALTLSSVLAVGYGGTGVTSLTNKGVLVGAGAAAVPTFVLPGASGHVLQSNGTDWVSAALSPPAGLTSFQGRGTAAAVLTTADVEGAIAAMPAGDLGTYGQFGVAGGHVAGAVVAGASLQWGYVGSGSSPAGTWQLMGQTSGGGDGLLFVRIA